MPGPEFIVHTLPCQFLCGIGTVMEKKQKIFSLSKAHIEYKYVYMGYTVTRFSGT